MSSHHDITLSGLLDEAQALADLMLSPTMTEEAIERADDSMEGLNRYFVLTSQATMVLIAVSDARREIAEMKNDEAQGIHDIDAALARFAIFIRVAEALAELNDRYLEMMGLQEPR